MDCHWHRFLTNITRTPCNLHVAHPGVTGVCVEVCACTRERANACGLIVNDSSAKRMRAQQPGENASCPSAGRNSESDQTVGFPDSHSPCPPLFRFRFFICDVATRRGRARLSSTQSVTSGAENNEAIWRNVKFSVTSVSHEIARRFETRLSYYGQL